MGKRKPFDSVLDDAAEDAVLEGEVIISEAGPFTEERTLWVYDRRDDFKITIPAGSRVTFGYFNPATPTVNQRNTWSNGPGAETMRTTCLRVYADGTDKRQLAAFLGVDGFRDMDQVRKTVMRRKVTIETNLEDDGVGNSDFKRKQALEAASYDEDTHPF